MEAPRGGVGRRPSRPTLIIPGQPYLQCCPHKTICGQRVKMETDTKTNTDRKHTNTNTKNAHQPYMQGPQNPKFGQEVKMKTDTNSAEKETYLCECKCASSYHSSGGNAFHSIDRDTVSCHWKTVINQSFSPSTKHELTCE